MDATSSSTALLKRTADDVALMPPPPIKKIKRPPKVLDEDDYTDALSEIIARDYFPGLQESRAQQEYLAALDSDNQIWIAEAAHNLRAAIDQKSARTRRVSRDARFDNTGTTPGNTPRATDTPRGYDGSSTPTSVAATEIPETTSKKLDTSIHSISSFQAKYTSEDNASFNDVLDKQNKTRREKHAHHWTSDGRIPTARQLAHRAQEHRLLAEKSQADADAAKHNDRALIPLTSGAVASRPAQPTAWKTSRPDNTFMFLPDSFNESNPSLPTILEQKEAASKAAPKETVHANTRFPSLHTLHSDDDPTPPGRIPPSPSLNTDIIAARGPPASDTEADYTGAGTPRVNGWAFVDDEEPEPEPPTAPTYRDLLAGQAPDSSRPNPFKLSAVQKREALHHRLVEKTAQGKRAKEKETTAAARGLPGTTPRRDGGGNMTPAAQKLMKRLGRTPVREKSDGGVRLRAEDLWTPAARTPRRKAVR
ncbi:uncharacterized protein HMPREF1541_05159 [Cyphellophora europaea CBS 101466]|uniref:Nuclear protein DGCR14 n=1 Tax=Cyphellophora europaea (strain CBS 101466) TaxID=1220924 RepID=W2RYZ0_CYPE1|nr:uncharacterized protein HMPREF1541_05159 [Cyphellophora europaea CBS 101466]ETN40879.1 hypothetical protein HMPREF1541_05159 [Cyphellophora europaea CBS 101466]